MKIVSNKIILVSGKLIKGDGVATAFLKKNGIKAINKKEYCHKKN